ncbi:MAG TPA: hypothetical protein VJ418_38935 [Streptosporangiaceae bacterium]|nr:hypothetical protein [Streptosporangiaceae bacterium]
MITPRGLRAPLSWTIGGLGVLDLGAAVILSGYAVALTSGILRTSHPHGGAAASVGVLFMTLPVAWRRPAPLAAAAVMAAAALLNGLVFGPMVRCGACLPAIFLVAYAVGVRRDRGPVAAGLLLCAAAVVAEGFYDPQIEGGGLIFVLPVLAAFFASGRLVRARTQTAAALRESSAELRRQREETARLAVLADRARVTADLEQSLHTQIGGLASTAATGLGALASDQTSDQAAARQALASIERDGRAVLGHLREVLSTLQERPLGEPRSSEPQSSEPLPSEPQPTLARLSELPEPDRPDRGRAVDGPGLRAPVRRRPGRAAQVAGTRRGRGLRRPGGGMAARPGPGGQWRADHPVLLDAVPVRLLARRRRRAGGRPGRVGAAGGLPAAVERRRLQPAGRDADRRSVAGRTRGPVPPPDDRAAPGP